jgi:hypothetical protein
VTIEGIKRNKEEEEGGVDGRVKRTGVILVIHFAQVLDNFFHSTTPFPKLSKIDLLEKKILRRKKKKIILQVITCQKQFFQEVIL